MTLNNTKDSRTISKDDSSNSQWRKQVLHSYCTPSYYTLYSFVSQISGNIQKVSKQLHESSVTQELSVTLVGLFYFLTLAMTALHSIVLNIATQNGVGISF